MLLTGTSVAALARGIGRGVRRVFHAVFLSGRARTRRSAAPKPNGGATARWTTPTPAPTDVMNDYPENDEDFEPTVAIADDSPFAEGVFDYAAEAAETEIVAEDRRSMPEPEAEDVPADDSAEPPPASRVEAVPDSAWAKLRGVTTSEEIDYKPPPMKALERGKGDKGPDPRDQEATGRKLVETLGHFGVEAKIVGVVSGPHVSRFELRLAPGIKVKKVTELGNDLAYALASTDIRILAPIPGKQAVGVEVPNTRRRMVRLGDIYAGRPEKTSPLVAWLGKGIDGNAVWTDLAKMPHVLVAGTTGSGKSGCVNAILSSILMQASPNEVRLVLVDPKQVELNHYENVPHLLTPVVTSPRLAANVLANLIGEMESRYGIMSARPLPQPRGTQPRPPQGRRSAAAAHPLRDRRARGPDDGRPGRSRGLDHPPRPEVAGHRHPPGAGDAASLDRHHHRHDQGQHPFADRLRRLLADRFARDPRPGRRRGAARPGRHALPRRRLLEAAARPGRLHHRGGDRPDHQALGASRANRNSRRSCWRRPRRRSRRARRRVRPRQRRPARRGDPAGGRRPRPHRSR